MKMSKDTQSIVNMVERNLSAAVLSVNNQAIAHNETHGSGAPSKKMVRRYNRPGGLLELQRGGIPDRKILVGARRVRVCGYL